MTTSKKLDKHATAIGRFYRKAMEYESLFKIGGCQKVQKIVGNDLFYRKGENWWWANSLIVDMPLSNLIGLTKTIEVAIKVKKLR
jgi:hypothetical protein